MTTLLDATGFRNLAAFLGAVRAPKQAVRYRRWRVWFDFGHFEHGIVYRETKWRAQSPTGTQIEGPPHKVGDWPWLKAEIDRLEGEKA